MLHPQVSCLDVATVPCVPKNKTGIQLTLACAVGFNLEWLTRPLNLRHNQGQNQVTTPPNKPAVANTLVVYIYSDTDPEYRQNLDFFVRFGMAAGDPCDYVIVVQGGSVTDPGAALPRLPGNARYVHHANECFDWGTLGWLLGGELAGALPRYRYLIMMNSSVRGPLLPAYYSGPHWSRIFTSRLTDEVKLVGPTLSCEAAPKTPDLSGEWRQNPHVQSYVLATDQAGLAAMRADAAVFACHANLHDTIYYSELGASRAVLQAGFNLDTLMLRYQGIDWRNASNWNCNQGQSPYAEHHYDGVTVDPLEAVFVKVKGFQADMLWAAPAKALRYDRWLTMQRTQRAGGPHPNVTANAWVADQERYRLPALLRLVALGPACFDWGAYAARNRDLVGLEEADLFSHYLHHGQFEGRPSRMLPDCAARAEAAAAKLAAGDLILAERAGPDDDFEALFSGSGPLYSRDGP